MRNRIPSYCLLGAIMATASLSPTWASLVADRTVLTEGDVLNVVSRRATDRRVDVHIGYMKGQGTPIFDTDPSGRPVPVYSDVSLNRPLLLADFTIPRGLESGLYIFYEILTNPGGDPNNVQDWAFGLGSLSQLAIYVNVSRELSGDGNGDGIPDDDGNRDGFRDRDRDRDGLVDSTDDSQPGVVPGEVAASLVREARLQNTGVFPLASGKVRYRIRGDGVQDFKVEAEDLPVGAYPVLVDALQVATLQVRQVVGGTEGEIEFRDPPEPGKLPLQFSPLGATIEISSNSGTVLVVDFVASGTAGTPGPGGQNGPAPRVPITIPADAAEIEVPLVNSGVTRAASGSARYRDRGNGVTDFKVEVEDLAVGNYVLRVGGVNRGTIRVVNVPGGTEGEIEFRNPVQPGKVLLDFSPKGQDIEVRDGSGRRMLSIHFPG